MSNNSSFSNPAPKNWEKVIDDMLKYEDVDDTPTCIYKVPQRLRDLKPEAYTPHYMGLGPYHHWRDDLYAMEAYKLIASMKSQEGCHNDKQPTQRLKHFVDCLENEIARIHASYDRQLDVHRRPLALMMVIDGIFLLQFLQELMLTNGSCLNRSKRTRSLVDTSKSAYHLILQDIMMLENQIPIFVLEKILSVEEFNEQDILPTMLCHTSMKLSPFKIPNQNNLRRPKATDYAHLLELLYYLIVPEETNNNDSTCQRYRDDDKEEPPLEERKEQKGLKDCLPNIPAPSLQNLPIPKTSKPWKVIHNMINLVTAGIPFIKGEGEKLTDDLENGRSSSSCEGNDKGAPKVEEIEIPSVSELLRVGIEFCPMNAPINFIKFDKKTRKFFLPSITINDNTEVITRNLVAYEAVGISGPSYLGRYTELMNGIIDTAEDVRLLKDRQIIIDNYLKSDDDVAQLWNGMSRSIRLSRIHNMDKAINEVNKYFDSHMKVKFIRFTKGCMLCGWKISMLLLTLLLLVLMAIQSFCQVYRCPRALGPVTEPEP